MAKKKKFPTGNVEMVRVLPGDTKYWKNTKTLSDIVYSKTVYMNGKKLSGLQSITIDYDITKPTTRVTLSMVIKRDSLKIESNKISFDEVGRNV